MVQRIDVVTNVYYQLFLLNSYFAYGFWVLF